MRPIDRVMSRAGRSLAALGIASVTACCGRRDYVGPPTPLLDRAFVAPSVDKRDTMMYEAQAVTNVFLFDELVARERDLRVDTGGLDVRANRFLLAMMFRVRQLSDSSAAVRTPSFNPSLRFEQHFLRADTASRQPAEADNRQLRAIRDVGYRVEWTHHSNGQAGCFRSGYTPDSTGDPDNCMPGSAADPTGVTLNRANGDFSTTYWGLTGFARRIAVRDDQEEKWIAEIGLGYQLHRFGGFGDARQEQRDLWGTHRGRLDAGLRYNFGVVQVGLAVLGERAENTDSRIVPWRAHLDLFVRSPVLLGAGAIVRFLDGQDYYNIGFAQRRSRIIFGILLDPSGLESPR